MTKTLNAAGTQTTTASKPGGGFVGPGVPQALLGTAAATGLLMSVFSGTTTTAPIAPTAGLRWLPALVRGTGVVLDSGQMTIVKPGPTDVVRDAVTTDATTSAQLVHWLHNQSGLTWEQLGKMFGVSRRAVHLWASGSRMNSTNLARLNEIVALVRELSVSTPDQARTRLMAVGTDGRSIVDQFRARSHDDYVNAPALAPEQLFDALPGTGDVRK